MTSRTDVSSKSAKEPRGKGRWVAPTVEIMLVSDAENNFTTGSDGLYTS